MGIIKVPRISGESAVAAFKKAGFVVNRIRGSHHILSKEGVAIRLSIPVHKGKTVGVGLLTQQIKAAGLSVEEFVALL